MRSYCSYRCPYFSAMFTNEMKEATSSEVNISEVCSWDFCFCAQYAHALMHVTYLAKSLFVLTFSGRPRSVLDGASIYHYRSYEKRYHRRNHSCKRI